MHAVQHAFDRVIVQHNGGAERKSVFEQLRTEMTRQLTLNAVKRRVEMQLAATNTVAVGNLAQTIVDMLHYLNYSL